MKQWLEMFLYFGNFYILLFFTASIMRVTVQSLQIL